MLALLSSLLLAGPARPVHPGHLGHEVAPLARAVERLFEATDGRPSPGLAVTVIHDGELLWFGGLGVRDRKSAEPVTADTVFAIASISKSVAAWGFLRLVESGVIGLDDPVVPRIEGWRPRKRRDESDGITLRRLLSHSAGLSVHGVEGVVHGRRLPSLLDAILGKPSGFRRVDLAQSPGSGYLYSGGGTSVAQLLFEQATGREFVAAMQQDVVLPLGMGSSGFHWNAERVAASATPYLPSGRIARRLDYPQAAPASFVASSRDMAAFALACLPSHRPNAAEAVLSRESLETMLARSPDAPRAGLGFLHKPIEGVATVGHTGGDRGWTSTLRLAPASGDALIVLQNCYEAEALSRSIESAWARWLRGKLR